MSEKKKHLEEAQVLELMYAAESRGRHKHRDATLVLMMYRHGLRACEASCLMWSDISFEQATIYVWRAKNGIPSTHKLQEDEVTALKELRRLYPSDEYVFIGEGSEQLTTDSIDRIIRTAAKIAKLDGVHPHTLRHSCGFALAEKGLSTRDIQGYLGHSNISSTAIYIAINPKRYESISW